MSQPGRASRCAHEPPLRSRMIAGNTPSASSSERERLKESTPLDVSVLAGSTSRAAGPERGTRQSRRARLTSHVRPRCTTGPSRGIATRSIANAAMTTTGNRTAFAPRSAGSAPHMTRPPDIEVDGESGDGRVGHSVAPPVRMPSRRRASASSAGDVPRRRQKHRRAISRPRRRQRATRWR